jgi:hypothetical protein
MVALPGLLSSLSILGGDVQKALTVCAVCILVPVLHFAGSMALLHALARHTDGPKKADAYLLAQASLSVGAWTAVWASLITMYFAVILIPLGLVFLAMTPAIAGSDKGVRVAPVLAAYTLFTLAYLGAIVLIGTFI